MALASMLTESELKQSPAWLPLRPAAGGHVTLLKLNESQYRSASFLDERLLGLGVPQAVCPPALMAQAARSLRATSHFIFHLGHVGSTLVSRLIGAHERFFALREPLPLRRLAAAPPGAGDAGHTKNRTAAPLEEWLPLELQLALYARTWHPAQRAVVKATSIVNEIAPRLLESADRPSALFMVASPVAYLQGILGGPNSRVEARATAQSRLDRLRRRIPEVADHRPTSEGELIAMNWLCEMTALHECARHLDRGPLWVDFDAFLRAPAAGLADMFRALGEPVPDREVESILAGPLMRQYSKAPEYAYDAALRREVLAAADAEHGAAIEQGMDWLGRLAARQPLAAQALEAPKKRGGRE